LNLKQYEKFERKRGLEMKKILALFAAIMLAVTFMPAFASAAVYATNVTGTPWYYPDGGTVGTEFKVNSTPVTINQLGVFDFGSNGLAESHAVGIWNGDALLASVTIPSGTAASLDKGFRWASITTPLTLSANTTYTLGAFYAGGADWFGSVATINSRFTLMRDLYLDGAFAKPTDGQGTVQGWYGPNMAFNTSKGPVATPIPATIWLLGAGLVGMLGLHRRFYA
jgi:hypothetical protein